MINLSLSCMKTSMAALSLVAFSLLTSSCINTRYALLDGQQVQMPSGSTLVIVPTTRNSLKKGEFDMVKKELSASCASIYFLDELDYDLRADGIDVTEIYNRSNDEIEKLFNWNKNVFVLEYENTLNKKNTLETRSHQSDPYNNQAVNNRSAEWILTLRHPDGLNFWKFKTMVTITATKQGGLSFNPYASAYYVSLRKALKQINKTAFGKCN